MTGEREVLARELILKNDGITIGLEETGALSMEHAVGTNFSVSASS
jgi:hypothetical protein